MTNHDQPKTAPLRLQMQAGARSKLCFPPGMSAAPFWTLALRTFVLVPAMNASIAQTAILLDSPMFATLAIYTIPLEFAMWAWIAFLTFAPRLAMLTWAALRAIELQPAMWAMRLASALNPKVLCGTDNSGKQAALCL